MADDDHSGDRADDEARDIALAKRGDHGAFTRLVNHYTPSVTAQMWRYSRDPVVLEELVQEVFVQAYRSIGSFKGTAPFEHWLRVIASRVGYRYWRSRDHRRQLDSLNREEVLQNLHGHVPSSPSDAAEAVYNLLALLPTPDRLVLTLLYLEECGTAEIAERLGWTRGVVKVRAYRARKRFVAILEEAGIRADDFR